MRQGFIQDQLTNWEQWDDSGFGSTDFLSDASTADTGDSSYFLSTCCIRGLHPAAWCVFSNLWDSLERGHCCCCCDGRTLVVGICSLSVTQAQLLHLPCCRHRPQYRTVSYSPFKTRLSATHSPGTHPLCFVSGDSYLCENVDKVTDKQGKIHRALGKEGERDLLIWHKWQKSSDLGESGQRWNWSSGPGPGKRSWRYLFLSGETVL